MVDYYNSSHVEYHDVPNQIIFFRERQPKQKFKLRSDEKEI